MSGLTSQAIVGPWPSQVTAENENEHEHEHEQEHEQEHEGPAGSRSGVVAERDHMRGPGRKRLG